MKRSKNACARCWSSIRMAGPRCSRFRLNHLVLHWNSRSSSKFQNSEPKEVLNCDSGPIAELIALINRIAWQLTDPEQIRRVNWVNCKLMLTGIVTRKWDVRTWCFQCKLLHKSYKFIILVFVFMSIFLCDNLWLAVDNKSSRFNRKSIYQTVSLKSITVDAQNCTKVINFQSFKLKLLNLNWLVNWQRSNRLNRSVCLKVDTVAYSVVEYKLCTIRSDLNQTEIKWFE